MGHKLSLPEPTLLPGFEQVLCLAWLSRSFPWQVSQGTSFLLQLLLFPTSPSHAF